MVVQPSHAEGLGLVILEAMSCGRAVVTTDIPATAEITGGHDVLATCEPGDVVGLADTIGSLLSNQERLTALEAAGRRHVLRLFTRDVMTRQTERALTKTVTAHRWRTGG